MIVIKLNALVDESQRKAMQKVFLKEADEGVIVLPQYCDLAGVSEDNEIEIEFEELEGEIDDE